MVISRSKRARAALPVLALALAVTALAGCERAQSTAGASKTPVVAPSTAPAPAHDTTLRVTAPPPSLADTVDPTATVRAYLARARMRRTTRDSLIWEPGADGANGFRAFADTVIATFTIGSPGRIEGAAGSRYVTIPIDVDVMTGSVPATLHGVATLRRAVVDGATDAQRRWRIVRIEWGAPR